MEKILANGLKAREGAQSKILRQAYVRAQLNSCQWCPLRFYDYVSGHLKIDIFFFFLLGKTVSTPPHPWRERPGQSGHYRSSLTRCNGNKDSVHMKPAPLSFGSVQTLVSSEILSAPVPPSLPLTACPLPGSGCIEGRTEGKIFRLSELTSIVKIWEMLTLKPVRELPLKDWAAHQCLLQPPSSLPRSPTAITNTPSTTVFATRCTRFIPTKLLVYLVGGGGLNQVFHHQIFQDVSWDHCLLKNYFRHTKYLYKYYLLVSCYSSFGCKL